MTATKQVKQDIKFLLLLVVNSLYSSDIAVQLRSGPPFFPLVVIKMWDEHVILDPGQLDKLKSEWKKRTSTKKDIMGSTRNLYIISNTTLSKSPVEYFFDIAFWPSRHSKPACLHLKSHSAIQTSQGFMIDHLQARSCKFPSSALYPHCSTLSPIPAYQLTTSSSKIFSCTCSSWKTALRSSGSRLKRIQLRLRMQADIAPPANISTGTKGCQVRTDCFHSLPDAELVWVRYLIELWRKWAVEIDASRNCTKTKAMHTYHGENLDASRCIKGIDKCEKKAYRMSKHENVSQRWPIRDKKKTYGSTKTTWRWKSCFSQLSDLQDSSWLHILPFWFVALVQTRRKVFCLLLLCLPAACIGRQDACREVAQQHNLYILGIWSRRATSELKFGEDWIWKLLVDFEVVRTHWNDT